MADSPYHTAIAFLTKPLRFPISEWGRFMNHVVCSCALLKRKALTLRDRKNFSSVLSEDDFSLELHGQVVLTVRKVHAGGGIRSAKVNIRHIDPSRCATTRHRRAHTFLRAHSVSPQTAILHSPERPPDSVLTISCTRLAGPRPTSHGLP